LFSDPILADQIAHTESWEPRAGKFANIPARLHPQLREKLEFDQLFSHQAQAIELALGGKDVVVSTGTNSGKTACFALPALDICLREPAARALLLFPTKALAQDQQARLEALAPTGIRVATYDGDTPQSHRSAIRKEAHLVLTNPDMLHVGMLPGHENWPKFLRNLRLIVVDEMHVYRGVFGSHVGNVLRRLLRLCAWYRTYPSIIASSGTIGNPQELFTRLTGRQAHLVDEDGSPSGRRTFVFYNPPAIDEQRRMSANVASAQITATLMEVGQRTLTFSRARISAELVMRTTQNFLRTGGTVAPTQMDAYRGGYTPKERRAIEQAVFKGKLSGLSATNAMELGVDIGNLDAVVLNGYPGSPSSFWQQVGRAGRGTRDGLAIFVAHNDPLEQFLLREPERLLAARQENVAANPANPTILSQHLVCAAYERPIAPSEFDSFGDTALAAAESLDRSGELSFRAGLFYYPAFDSPALRVNIRSGDSETVRLLLGTEELGSMERWRAMGNAHPGAVYLHRGQSFIVRDLDLLLNVAFVEPFDGDYYTSPIRQSLVQTNSDLIDEYPWRLQSVSVSESVVGFRRKSLDGDSVLDTEELTLPARTFDTVAVRLDLPSMDPDGDMAEQIGGVHGMEHALTAVAPWLIGADRGDLGSAWYVVTPDTLLPSVFVYDQTPGGLGFSERLFHDRLAWRESARQLVASCSCQEGCPACLLSPRCESANEALSKPGTLKLL
jgi:DEAD/DEAH box helicase domain-containing protein